MMKKRFILLMLLSYALPTHVVFAKSHSPNHKAHHKTHKASKVIRAAYTRDGLSPLLASNIALIIDEQTQRPLYKKNSEQVAPIASITKLMTAMVVLDAVQSLDEQVSVGVEDLDMLKGTRSRLRIGMAFTRSEMLKLALMASENRAASALARSYPGGTAAAVAAMNAKAQALGMTSTKFFDPTGLNSDNVSTAQDLVKMVAAAHNYSLIHEYTTTGTHSVDGLNGRELRFNNTNPLVRNASWDIGVSKTGFINEAGRCLVMEATINRRPVIIVLLDSVGKRTRIVDANRIKQWMENTNAFASIPTGRG
jgi:D-alanyl-D-alanine endopeptidase (penicillin-binding protein 7)